MIVNYACTINASLALALAIVVNAAFLFFETSKLWALIMYIFVE